MSTLEAPPPPTETPVDKPRTIPIGRFPYGWDAVPIMRPVMHHASGRVVDGTFPMEPVLDVQGKPLEEQLPFPQRYARQFTHTPRTIILGAAIRGGHWAKALEVSLPEDLNTRPLTEQATILNHYERVARRRNECKSVRYIVWRDRSLRRTDKLIRKQLSVMSPEQQTAFVSQAAQSVE